MIFASFSLFSRAEPVVTVVLFVYSLSHACALILIVGMDRLDHGDGPAVSGVMAIPNRATF